MRAFLVQPFPRRSELTVHFPHRTRGERAVRERARLRARDFSKRGNRTRVVRNPHLLHTAFG